MNHSVVRSELSPNKKPANKDAVGHAAAAAASQQQSSAYGYAASGAYGAAAATNSGSAAAAAYYGQQYAGVQQMQPQQPQAAYGDGYGYNQQQWQQYNTASGNYAQWGGYNHNNSGGYY